jgi:hypothetical protein
MPGTFYGRFEKALRVSATDAPVAGRLQGKAPVNVIDLANPLDTLPAPAAYELFGPGDVQRLAAGTITRRYPAPGAADAEETKLALVEFGPVDLPWRYTPERAAGGLRPWLVLVVGHRAPDEIVVRRDGRVTIGPVTQGNHQLAQSARWAHVHEIDGKRIARILSPLTLDPDQEYVACLVPAFTANGGNSWAGGPAVTVDCYDRWTFRTGPKGDFPELAQKLQQAKLVGLKQPFGRAAVTYSWRAPHPVPSEVMQTAGALRLPPQPGDPADGPLAADLTAEVNALTTRIVTPDGRGVITAPRYDAPFGDADHADDPAVPGGWVDQLRSDPRSRGAAGLGAWNAIEWQDRISDAAAAKAGDLAIAADRIRHVALGIEAARSLWRRRVPVDPLDRLTVLAPVLGRLPSTAGAPVLDEITGHTTQLGSALFSSAARRALRPGPARTALAQDGAGRLPGVLTAANECEPRVDDPADIRRGAGDPESATKDAVFTAANGDDEAAERVLEKLGPQPSTATLIAAFAALAPGKDGRPDRDAVERFLKAGDFRDPDTPLIDWPDYMDEHAPPEPCRPINLIGLAGAVSAAVDPTVPQPPAVRRVLSTLPGFTHIGPVEIEPELDLPLWSFLSQRSPDWLLPGANDLQENDVVALSTNPGFVQALLAGANQQTTGELRWRNIPMVTRSSPLRKFWQRVGGELDINPLKQWPTAEPLGSTALAFGGRGSEAVVAFRTTLFRRYPATVVYLYSAQNNFSPPPSNEVLALAPDPTQFGRKDPTFTGTIGPDITFFGFPVPPEALAYHWVVLEEPPAGYRFYEEFKPTDDVMTPVDDGSAQGFAYNRFATPVRVLIGELL